MLRFAFIALLLGSAAGFCRGPAQESSSQPVVTDSSDAPAPQEVLDAEASIVKSDWKAAEAKLTPWLADHPTDARALFAAGYVADAQGRLDEAEGLYRRAVESNPKSFESRLSLGLLLAQQLKFDEARPELEAATFLDPVKGGPELKARAWRALAEINQSTDPAEASNDLLQALKLSPETEADTLLAANLADKTGQYAEAEAAFRRVLANDPKSAEANAGVAHFLIARKEYPAAETLLRSALEQTPDDPALTAQLASVLAAQDKAEALPLLQKLHISHPGTSSITRMLAEVLADSGDAAGSDKLYIELLATSPNDPDLLVGHGQNLVHQAKYPEAFDAFEKAARLAPSSPEAWSGLAFAASKNNQPSVTLNALTMRSKLLPEVPSTYFLWATSYDTLHNKVEAIRYYHHFLEAAAGKFPDQEWRARQRLILLENNK